MNTITDVQELRSANREKVAAIPAPNAIECIQDLHQYVVYNTLLGSKCCKVGVSLVDIVYTGNSVVWCKTLDKVYTMKLGKFLYKVGLVDNYIKELVEHQKVFESSTDSYNVLITKDSDEIVEAYEVPLYATDSTVKSCMTGSESVRVYGDNEELSLFLVYNEHERLVARTLVRDYKDKTGYIRVYSDRNLISSSVVYKLLQQHGYSQVVDLDRCCLDKVFDDSNNIVCPYLDGDVKGILVYSSTLLITSGDHHFLGDSTNGVVSGTSCDCCERVVPDDDIQRSVSDVWVCSDCVADHYLWFGKSLYHENEVTQLNVHITYEGNEYSYIPTNFIA
jgi:hypothetical protein